MKTLLKTLVKFLLNAFVFLTYKAFYIMLAISTTYFVVFNFNVRMLIMIAIYAIISIAVEIRMLNMQNSKNSKIAEIKNDVKVIKRDYKNLLKEAIYFGFESNGQIVNKELTYIEFIEKHNIK